MSSSEVQSIKSYPSNAVITALHKVGSIPISLIYSIVRLPAVPLPPVLADDRLGYFTTNYVDLGYHYNSSSHPRHAATMIDSPVSLVNRKRVSTDRPIKYYIDPSVPEEWRHPLKRGVENWRPAFAAVGLGDEAISAVLPGDSDWPEDYDAGDARYSTISWAIDPISTFAIGPSTVDPRSGEIINSDIVFTQGWIHAWMSELDNAGASSQHVIDSLLRDHDHHDHDHHDHHHHHHDHAHAHAAMEVETLLGQRPRARASPCGCAHTRTDDMLRGADVGAAVVKLAALVHDIDLAAVIHAGLTDVAQHEVGHTLGLRHNFKGSSARTWEETGNPAYVAEHGLTSSVMDYLPMNIRLGHATDASLLFTPVIGEYDLAAIQYGYAQVSPEARAAIAATGLAFATDEDGSGSTSGDHLASTWDLSDDPVRWYTEQMRVVRSLRVDLDLRAVAEGESWVGFAAAERTLLDAVYSAGLYVAKAVGGYVVSRDHRSASPADFHSVLVVDAGKQDEALTLILDVVSETGEGSGLFANGSSFHRMVSRGGYCQGIAQNCLAVQPYDVLAATDQVKRHLLTNVLSPTRMKRLVMTSRHERSDVMALALGVLDPLTPSTLLHKVVARVWGTDRGDLGVRVASPARWDVQTHVVDKLLYLAGASYLPVEVTVAAYGTITRLQHLIDTCFNTDGEVAGTCAGALDIDTAQYLNATRTRLSTWVDKAGW